MINIDFKSRTPIYEQLISSIREAAILGQMKPDEQLPSVRTLSTELGINPNTVQKAYVELEHLGIIYSVSGKGSFITSDVSLLIEKKKAEIEKNIKNSIITALSFGMSKEEIQEFINNFLSGKEIQI